MNFLLIDTKLRQLAAGNDEYAALTSASLMRSSKFTACACQTRASLAKQLIKQRILPEIAPMSAIEVRDYLLTPGTNWCIIDSRYPLYLITSEKGRI